MKKKIAVVIGYGSIGIRYSEILLKLGFLVYCYDVKKIISNDSSSRIKILKNTGEILSCDPKIIIISTPPSSHLDCLKIAIKTNAKILLEKPLASSKKDSSRILKISKINKGRVWCVSNMRYHPGFELIEKKLKILGKIYSVNSHFSHRLSQMRSSKLNTYASNKKNGGVILDCVHELDLLFKLFGKLNLENSRKASIGREKIQAEDYADLWLSSKKGIKISLHLDFLSKLKSRGLKIIGDKGTLIWECVGKNPEINTIKLYGSNKLKKSFLEKLKVDSNLVYMKMLTDFIKKKKRLQSVEDAFKVLDMSLKARK